MLACRLFTDDLQEIRRRRMSGSGPSPRSLAAGTNYTGSQSGEEFGLISHRCDCALAGGRPGSAGRSTGGGIGGGGGSGLRSSGSVPSVGGGMAGVGSRDLGGSGGGGGSGSRPSSASRPKSADARRAAQSDQGSQLTAHGLACSISRTAFVA